MNSRLQSNRSVPGEVSLAAVATAVLWVGCTAASLTGFLAGYPRPQGKPPPLPLVQTELLNVQLASEPAVLAGAASVAEPASQPPPIKEAVAPAEAPPMIAVARPNAAIAFTLPVEGPVQLLEQRRAAYVRQPSSGAPTVLPGPPVQTLTYGRGEGKQPAPLYPARAMREGQEGTVRVRFTVGPDGRVLEAEPAVPCAWALLNDAAAKTVRERWRFAPGAVRRYEVAIRFELTR